MKKVLVMAAAALVLALAFTGSAEAKCGSACLNRKVTRLSAGLARAEKTIKAQSQTIASLTQTVSSQGSAIASQSQEIKQANAKLGCIEEIPISRYGDPFGEFGYVFQFENETTHVTEEVDTSALDVPFKGEFVGGWFLADRCNTSETATTKASGAFAPPVGLSGLLPAEARSR